MNTISHFCHICYAHIRNPVIEYRIVNFYYCVSSKLVIHCILKKNLFMVLICLIVYSSFYSIQSKSRCHRIRKCNLTVQLKWMPTHKSIHPLKIPVQKFRNCHFFVCVQHEITKEISWYGNIFARIGNINNGKMAAVKASNVNYLSINMWAKKCAKDSLLFFHAFPLFIQLFPSFLLIPRNRDEEKTQTVEFRTGM